MQDSKYLNSVGCSHKEWYHKRMSYIVYMLRCADDTLYVGSTSDMEKRIHQHNNLKSGAHYTKIRRPVSVVYTETAETYAGARAREAEIKNLKRIDKLELIQSMLCE